MLAYINRCFTQIIFGAKKQVCFLSIKDCCGVGDCLNCCRIGWKHCNGGMNRLGGGELLNLSINYGEKNYENSRKGLHSAYKGRRGLKKVNVAMATCHGVWRWGDWVRFWVGWRYDFRKWSIVCGGVVL